MGKTRNAIDSDKYNNSYENADVENKETDEEEEPSEEDPCEDGPVEENSSEGEQDEADPYEEPEEEDPCEEEPSEEDPCEEEPCEEDPCEEEPCEEDPCEEEPDEDSLHAPNSEKLCGEESNELLCKEESNEVTSCEEKLNKYPCGEGSCEEEYGGEPNEEQCEVSHEEHCESEPSEDPEPNEEPYEEDPSEGSCEEEPSESEVPSEDDGETIKSNSQQKSVLANAMSVPKGNTGSLDINLLGKSHNMSNTEKVDITKDRSKKRRTRWDIDVVSNGTTDGNNDVANEKRKTRWSSDNCQLKETAHLKLPDIALNMEIVKLQAQLFHITNKLQARELVDDRAEDKRSPSPPPICNNLGIRLNSREARLRAKLMLQRQEIISELIQKNPNYKPPPDNSKKPKLTKKLYIPCKENPGYNFVGLIIGPRGNTQKRMENETGARIYLRGRGSVKDGERPKEENRYYYDDDELHVLVEADNQFSLDSAVVLVEKLLTPMKDGENRHKLAQLRELALLNGNLKETLLVKSMKMGPCDVCGDTIHSTSGCPLTASVPGANINKHEIKFLAEVGGGFSSSSAAPLANPYIPSVTDKGSHKTRTEIDDTNLFVGYLPQTVDDKKLVELFLPFGKLCQAKVVRDWTTGLSKGSGFVKYTDRVNAAKAVMHMNGYKIDGKVLAVRIAGVPLSPVNPNAGSGVVQIAGVALYPVNPNAGSGVVQIAGVAPYPVNPNAGSGVVQIAGVAPYPVNPNAGSGGFLIPNQFPNYPGYVAIAHDNPYPMCWPGPPGSVLPVPQNPFSGQHSLSSAPSYQPRLPSTLPSADVATSDELAHFPGYLKSFDPPSQLQQPSPFSFTPDSRHP